MPFLDEMMRTEITHVQQYCMFPPYPWSLVGYDNLISHDLLHSAPIEGSFAEFGVGEGGTSIYFARKAKMYGRKFLSVDSFAGLPKPTESDNQYFLEGDYGPPKGVDNHKAFLELVDRMDVNDTVTVVKGFFGDIAIPDDPAFEKFVFVHLDSDLYQSIYDSFMKIWDRVVPGGFVIVDDYFHFVQGPARAVTDFFRDHVGEPPVLFVLPVHAVLIVKGMSACLADAQAPGGTSSRPDWGEGATATRPAFTRALDGNFYSFQALRSIEALHRTVEVSVARVTAEYEERRQKGQPVHELERVRRNAESFLGFLRYPATAPQSSVDLYRYLASMEDVIDLQEAYDCRAGGRQTKNEINIDRDRSGPSNIVNAQPSEPLASE